MSSNRFSESGVATPQAKPAKRPVAPPSRNGSNGRSKTQETCAQPTGAVGKPAPSEQQCEAPATPPSPNGVDGAGVGQNSAADPNLSGQERSPNPPSGRDTNGRFAKGNVGGPGNPFGREVAALRQAACEVVSADDLRNIMTTMRDLALAGNVQAAKFVFAYTIGKPTPAPNPDTLDMDEWKHLKNTAPMMRELMDLATPDPSVPLACARAMREAKTMDQGGILGRLFTMPPAARDKISRLAATRDPRTLDILRSLPPLGTDPATISAVGAAPPSPNGKNAAAPPRQRQ